MMIDTGTTNSQLPETKPLDTSEKRASTHTAGVHSYLRDILRNLVDDENSSEETNFSSVKSTSKVTRFVAATKWLDHIQEIRTSLANEGYDFVLTGLPIILSAKLGPDILAELLLQRGSDIYEISGIQEQYIEDIRSGAIEGRILSLRKQALEEGWGQSCDQYSGSC